jgi:hypothetical protein
MELLNTQKTYTLQGILFRQIMDFYFVRKGGDDLFLFCLASWGCALQTLLNQGKTDNNYHLNIAKNQV